MPLVNVTNRAADLCFGANSDFLVPTAVDLSIHEGYDYSPESSRRRAIGPAQLKAESCSRIIAARARRTSRLLATPLAAGAPGHDWCNERPAAHVPRAHEIAARPR